MRASLSSSSSASASRETRCAIGAAAVGQPDLDLEWIAAIDGRRPRGGGVELARHHLVQALEDQLLADRRDAVGRRGGNLRLLDRLVEQVGLVPADLLRVRPGADLGRVADPPGHAGLTRENEWTRNCESVGALVSLSIATSRPSSTP